MQRVTQSCNFSRQRNEFMFKQVKGAVQNLQAVVRTLSLTASWSEHRCRHCRLRPFEQGTGLSWIWKLPEDKACMQRNLKCWLSQSSLRLFAPILITLFPQHDFSDASSNCFQLPHWSFSFSGFETKIVWSGSSCNVVTRIKVSLSILGSILLPGSS